MARLASSSTSARLSVGGAGAECGGDPASADRSTAGASGSVRRGIEQRRGLVVAELAQQAGEVAQGGPLVGPVAGAGEVVDDISVAAQTPFNLVYEIRP